MLVECSRGASFLKAMQLEGEDSGLLLLSSSNWRAAGGPAPRIDTFFTSADTGKLSAGFLERGGVHPGGKVFLLIDMRGAIV